MPKKIKYKVGEVINGLIYIRDVPRKSKYIRRVLLKCHCGKEFECGINFVRYGNTLSCGCGRIKHGLTYTKMWYLHNDMIQRCYNPNHSSYHNYGGRGIGVCDEWRNSIETFRDYVTQLSNYGKDGYSMDRINNNGNYEPGNLRWVNAHIQATNQNVRSDSKTGIKGVFFNKEKKKYLSEITVYKKRNNLGYHTTKEDALQARNNFIIQNQLWEYPIQKI